MIMHRKRGVWTTRTALAGFAAAVGLCAMSATPTVAQEVYLGAPPSGRTVIIQERGYVVPPEPRVIIREPVSPGPGQVIVREAPERVIVTEPVGGPYENDVYVREVAPDVLPLETVGPRVRRGIGEDCQIMERETSTGLLQVSEWCQ